MDKIELEIKRDESTINDIAEKLELVSNTNMVTKEAIFKKIVAKDVKKKQNDYCCRSNVFMNMRKK